MRAKGQVNHGQIGHRFQLQQRKQFRRALACRPILGTRLRQAQRIGQKSGTARGMRARQNIFAHRHGFEQGQVLEGTPKPKRRHAVARFIGSDMAIEAHTALIRAVDAADHIEQRCLARAIRADQAANLAFRHIEGNAGNGGHTTKTHDNVAHFKQRHGALPHRLRSNPAPDGE